MISNIETNCSSLSCNQGADSFVSAQVSQAKATSLSIKQSSDFTLYTDEGDKVTISMEAQQLIDYIRAGSVSIDGESIYTADMESFSLEASNDFSILIEGDLNQEEQKDISKALKTIHNLIRDFMSGKTDKMGKYTHRLAGLDSLAGIEGQMSYEKTNIMASEMIADVSALAAMPTESDGEKSEPAEYRYHPFQDIPNLTDRVVDEIKGFKHDKMKLVKAVNSLFEHYLENRKENGENRSGRFQVSEIHCDLFSKIAEQNLVEHRSA